MITWQTYCSFNFIENLRGEMHKIYFGNISFKQELVCKFEKMKDIFVVYAFVLKYIFIKTSFTNINI